MPPYFLTVRFQLVFLGGECLERLQDKPPVHEKDSHVFYQTDLQVVAEKLLELFRQDKSGPTAWNPAAPVRDLVEKVRCEEPINLFPTPIFEVIDGADVDFTECVRSCSDVRQLQEIAPTSFLDPEGWALLGFPSDRRTVLLVWHYKQARQWEPLVRDELDGNGAVSGHRGIAEIGDASRVWIWALRPLEQDHTPNMCCSINDAPGRVGQMLHNDRTGAVIPGYQSPHGDGWKVWHRYYRPATEDISILKAAYPAEDPQNPKWLRIKRDLVGAGYDPAVLTEAEAPVLLGMLESVRSSSAGRRKRKARAIPAGKRKIMKGTQRRSLSPDDEAKILERCRRRCCVCYALDHDDSEKKGQLAHLDHDHSNNAIDNFVFLCLPHHDTYDSKTSQVKNLTEREVRLYQARLHEAVDRGEVPSRQTATVLKLPTVQAGPVSINGDGNVVTSGDVNYVVNMPKARRGKGRSANRPPIIPGTVPEDPRMVGYLNYLVRRYEKFKKWECDLNGKRMGWGVIRNAYKRDMKYELIHTPKGKFEEGTRYLQGRIEKTQLGRRRKGQKLYSDFEDFDERTSDKESLPVDG